MFTLLKKDEKTKARLGRLETAHGMIESPFFMPVGTNATVKGLSAEDLLSLGAQIILSNAYHLYLRPGEQVIQKAQGLHPFMSWEKSILTDSGGYQVFSLTKFREITDEGVKFRSHLDGSTHFFTPEIVIQFEKMLGSDIIMPLDECAPYPCERKQAQRSVERTTQWAKRSRHYFDELRKSQNHQSLFGIIQGATFRDLREKSAEEILALDFAGFAIGGISVGEPVDVMFETLLWVMPFLPEHKPRYLMGVGLPDQMVCAVAEGIDMFDTCVPTRYGRHGSAFTSEGKIVLRNAEFSLDPGPIDKNCDCFVCQRYSRSYLRHLVNMKETLGLRLISYHNVYFYHRLMRMIREALRENRFAEFKNKFLSTYMAEPQEAIKSEC